MDIQYTGINDFSRAEEAVPSPAAGPRTEFPAAKPVAGPRTSPGEYFDYTGNGRIDFADVVWLFNHL